MGRLADIKRGLAVQLRRHPAAHRLYRRVCRLPAPPPPGFTQVWVALPKRGSRPHPALMIEAPGNILIPKMLRSTGLAGYEPETLACFLAVLDSAPAGPVWDVGANIGIFAMLAAAMSDRDVVAFEPTPETLDVARESAARNGLKIECRQLALAAEVGTATLYLSTKSDTSNSLQAGFRTAHSSIDVELNTVDNLVMAGQEAPAVMKLDTEMTEPDVLRGAAESIAKYRPWILCEVLARRAESRLQQEIEKHGYSWFPITDEDPLVRSETLAGNNRFPMWLFAPEEPTTEFWGRLAHWRTELQKCQPQRWPSH